MKKWKSFDFDSNSTDETERKLSMQTKSTNEIESVQHKTTRSNCNKKVVAKNSAQQHKVTTSNFNFDKKVLPRDSAQLSVNKNKLDSLRQWLNDFVINVSNQIVTPILVITGPTGCAKTTTLTVLCKELNIEILEWINPLSLSYEYESRPSQITQFLEFMLESKYPSLVSNLEKKIVLIEDFPNVFLSDYEEFHEVLDKIVYLTTVPMVFMCTDTNHIKTNLYLNLFPEEIQIKYQITTISFIPASVTLLKAALNRAQRIVEDEQHHFTVPSSDVIEAIANSAMGDVRCAINNYYLAALSGGTKITRTSEKEIKKRKRKSFATAAVLRDGNLGIFHLLGRILNPRRKEHSNSWRLDCDLEEIVEEFMTYPNTGLNLLKHNYLKYFDDFDEACEASDVLSQTQIFMESSFDQLELQELALWYCTLGIMIANKHKVSKWNQIKAPKRNKETNSIYDSEEMDPMDGYYYDKIKNTNKFHKFV